MKKGISLTLVFFILVTLTACNGKGSENAAIVNGGRAFTHDLDLTVWETQGTDYVAEAEINDDVVAKWLYDKTKVKVKNIYGNDGGQWDTKLSKLVAGNNLPDILHCGAGQGPAHFAKMKQLDKVWELTPEMIKEYAPRLWERTSPEAWADMTIDGKIFGIPYSIDQPNKITCPELSEEDLRFITDLKITLPSDVRFGSLQSLWIRDDILKEYYPQAKSYDELVKLLGERGEPIGDELLDVPIKSTEEFIAFMYKVKADHPTENGKQLYTFGYSGGDNWIALTWLGADMYGYKGHNYAGTWNSVTQRYEIPLVHDTIRKAAKTQNEMINDKIIDPESLAHNISLFKEKILTGQYVIAPLEAVGLPSDINKQLEKAGKSFRFRPFITQVPALAEYRPFTTKSKTWTESLCLLKTLSEEEVHQVLNWINVQYTDAFDEVKNWGTPEDKLYTENADGSRSFTDERFTRYFVEGKTEALEKQETRGLQGKGGAFGVYAFDQYSRWTPVVMYKKAQYTPVNRSGFKFKSTSSHIVKSPVYPPTSIWAPVYAEIPEVVTFWAQREQWEGKIKLAMAAKKEDFDAEWDEMIAAVNGIADVANMEESMTQVAKRLADALQQ